MSLMALLKIKVITIDIYLKLSFISNKTCQNHCNIIGKSNRGQCQLNSGGA